MARSAARKTVVCTARCEDCGNLSANVSWSPGDTCPHCGSHHFTPVPRIRGNSDYESADRSQGFAIEDIRFGRLAVWAGMLAQKRFQMALRQQQRIAHSGRSVPDLGTLLVQQKLLTKRQKAALLRVLVAVPGNSADREFVQTAAKSGYISEDRLAACEALQSKMARDGLDAPPLPLLAYERRLLKENQIVALLKSMEQRGCGLLHNVQEGAYGSATHAIEALLGSGKDKRARVKQIAAIAIILLAAVFLVYRFAGGAAYAQVKCESCGAEFGAPENSDWPIECLECGEETVYPLVICLDCGERYISKGVGYGKSCPKCKSSRFVPITNEMDIGQIEREIEARKSGEDAL